MTLPWSVTLQERKQLIREVDEEARRRELVDQQHAGFEGASCIRCESDRPETEQMLCSIVRVALIMVTPGARAFAGYND